MAREKERVIVKSRNVFKVSKFLNSSKRLQPLGNISLIGKKSRRSGVFLDKNGLDSNVS